MAKIALIWELGADLGHITRYSIIARELILRGHEPVFVLKDVTRIRHAVQEDSTPVYQAPVFHFRPQGLPPAVNLTETLFLVGFLEDQKLLSLVKAWRHTFDAIAPDVLVFDHAPVAQLAARGLNYKKVIVTNSFSVPPSTTPLAPYRFWHNDAKLNARMNETEQRCKKNANFVLKTLNQNPLDCMANLFEIDERIICERPEFDVYGPRTDVSYVGPINDDSLGTLPRWPNHSGPKIFAYLKVIFPHIELLLSILSRLNAQTIAYVPGLSTAMRDKYQNHALTISDEPLKLSTVVKECDYGLCHGGTGTMNTFVESGIPVFALPLFIEQMMLSKRVEVAGLGKLFPLQGEADTLAPMLNDFLNDKHLLSTTAAWAENEKTESMAERSNLVCDRIEALLLR